MANGKLELDKTTAQHQRIYMIGKGEMADHAGLPIFYFLFSISHYYFPIPAFLFGSGARIRT